MHMYIVVEKLLFLDLTSQLNPFVILCKIKCHNVTGSDLQFLKSLMLSV